MNASARLSSRSDAKEENPAGRNIYNILLIGETGSGKSTLINYLTNYFQNGSLNNLKIAIPTKHHRGTEGLPDSEKDLQDSTKSKTGKCTSYDFTKDGLRYAFIDTPGLSDTAGTEKDTEHILEIMDTAAERGTIAAIMLVINGTVARATVNLRNTIMRMKSSVPDVLLKNLIVVLTNCSFSSANFDLIQLKPWTIPKENVFYMDNSALSKRVGEWLNDEEKLEEITYAWNKSMKVIKKMMTRINHLGPIASNAFIELRNRRVQIRTELIENMRTMKELNIVHGKLLDLKKDNEAVSTKIKAYSDYKQEAQYSIDIFELCDDYNILCAKCTKLCCPECQTEGWPMYFCGKNKGSICASCNHPWMFHFGANVEPKTITKIIQTVLVGAKKMFDENTQRKVEIEGKISTFDEDIQTLNRGIDAKLQTIRDCCTKMKQICSQFNFADEVAVTIALLETDLHSLTNLEVRALAEAKINDIRKFATSFTAT